MTVGVSHTKGPTTLGWVAMAWSAVSLAALWLFVHSAQDPLAAMALQPIRASRAGSLLLNMALLAVPLAVLLLLAGVGVLLRKRFGRTAGLLFVALSVLVNGAGLWIVAASTLSWRQRAQGLAAPSSGPVLGQALSWVGTTGLSLALVIAFGAWLRALDRQGTFGPSIVGRPVGRGVPLMTLVLCAPAILGAAGLWLPQAAPLATGLVLAGAVGLPLVFVGMLVASLMSAFRAPGLGQILVAWGAVVLGLAANIQTVVMHELL